MKSYLKLMVGEYLLLLPTDEVFEVREYAPEPGERNHKVWRGRILPAVSMRRRLHLPERDDGVMIVRGHTDGSCECLVVDKVLGLVAVPDSDFQPFPRSVGVSAAHFDKVWTERANGQQALRLRGIVENLSCVGSTLIH